MSHPRRRKCQTCGEPIEVVGPISWNGNCIPCAKAIEEESNWQIAMGRGWAHNRRIRGYERYLAKLKVDHYDEKAQV